VLCLDRPPLIRWNSAGVLGRLLKQVLVVAIDPREFGGEGPLGVQPVAIDFGGEFTLEGTQHQANQGVH
jgi:hypothetical protein